MIDERTRIAIEQFNELKKSLSDIRLAAEGWNEAWKTLIAIIMSARTRDETTIIVANRLFEKYNSLEQLANANIKEIEEIIKSVNFYKNKSKNILRCAKELLVTYDGYPPHDFEKLIELPGVGRKTANVFLAEMGKDEIGVDTHVFYISRTLGWTKNKDPKYIEEDLKRLFPKRYWRNMNYILVRFGKTYTSRKKKSDLLKSIKKLSSKTN